MAFADQANACVSTSTTPLDPHERLGPAGATPSVGNFSTDVWVRALGAEYAENSRKYVYFVFHPAQNGIRIPRIPRISKRIRGIRRPFGIRGIRIRHLGG